MARRLALIPALPRLTVSEAENFVERVCSASAFRMDLELSQAAPAAVAERTRNSRRRMGPPMKGRLRKRLHQGTLRWEARGGRRSSHFLMAKVKSSNVKLSSCGKARPTGGMAE